MPPRAEGRCYIVAEAAASAREIAEGMTWRQGTEERTIQGVEIQVVSEGRGVNLPRRSHARRGLLQLPVSLSISRYSKPGRHRPHNGALFIPRSQCHSARALAI